MASLKPLALVKDNSVARRSSWPVHFSVRSAIDVSARFHWHRPPAAPWCVAQVLRTPARDAAMRTHEAAGVLLTLEIPRVRSDWLLSTPQGSDRQRRFRKSLGDSRSHPVTPIGGAGSSPRHHLELRRPGGGEAITYAVDVRWRDVDAQQDRALSDLSLQGLSRFPW